MRNHFVRALMSGFVPLSACMAVAAGCIPAPPGAVPADDASTKRVAGDADGDGRADIVWGSSDGRTITWLMSGAPTPTQPLTAPAGFVAIGRGFFDGDRFTDILFRNTTTGELGFHAMKGGVSLGFVSLGTFDPTDTFVCTGDFDGDGLADTIWRKAITDNNAGGYIGGDTLLLQNGAATMSTLQARTPAKWQPVACADFDGDGTDNVFWRNLDNMYTSIWQMKEGKYLSDQANIGIQANTADVVGAGDFDMDGKADLLWTDASALYAWYQMPAWYATNPDGKPPTQWLASSTEPIVAIGDYDGDGSSDALAMNGVDNSVVIWHTQVGQKPSSLSVAERGPSGTRVVR